ncbi:efflux RND transporter periplasmic adaptor subunit [Stieleria sp. JC731]|uniref:efflux RND transporter periplasmic adaptor subunit n=1 Tax=Pirellulaceae TaxID=2691357 RepID=UPI001E491644|nr:efflux RND transporter periplasmic adaptor subunit [Stieleria sp. JC731]MCC9600265.1 efflux RND transporter periplasmic adaptor subunit [Stieleria sp. JC731]
MKFGLALPLAMAGMIAGCGSKAPPTTPAPQATPVVASKPIVMPIVEWDEYTGRFDAINSVEIRSRVGGYLQSTHFEEGQMVQAGDLLAIIDPRPFRAEVNAAKARLEEANAGLKEAQSILRQTEAEKADAEAQLSLATSRFERARQLSQQRAISDEEVEVRRSETLQATASFEAANARIESSKAAIATSAAAIETAKANLQSAELNLQYTEIRAPINGLISSRNVTEGNLISGGSETSTLLTSIVSVSPIHIYFDANEQEFLKYVRLAKAGKRESSRNVKNPVYVSLIDEEGYPHQGHMDFVDNRIDPNTGTMRGRAILRNDEGLLTPGLFAKVRLPGSGRYDAVMIPDEAVISDQSEKYVYVVDSESKLHRQTVQLGSMSHGMRIVREGLTGSETIVTSGLQRIFEGAQVAVTEQPLKPKSSVLPDDYKPVPEDQWLTRAPEPAPIGIKRRSSVYGEPLAMDKPSLQFEKE